MNAKTNEDTFYEGIPVTPSCKNVTTMISSFSLDLYRLFEFVFAIIIL